MCRTQIDNSQVVTIHPLRRDYVLLGILVLVFGIIALLIVTAYNITVSCPSACCFSDGKFVKLPLSPTGFGRK